MLGAFPVNLLATRTVDRIMGRLSRGLSFCKLSFDDENIPDNFKELSPFLIFLDFTVFVNYKENSIFSYYYSPDTGPKSHSR